MLVKIVPNKSVFNIATQTGGETYEVVWIGLSNNLEEGQSIMGPCLALVGRDEQFHSTLSLSARSQGASGGLHGINTILKIQFTYLNPNPYFTNALINFQCRACI